MALETELQHFEAIKQDLLAHHEDKYALIVGRELVGVFDSREEAYRVGMEKVGNVPMLIRLISRQEQSESIPAMTLGLLGARL